MTMRFGRTRADVTTPEGQVLEGVSIYSRNGRLSIQSRSGSQIVDVEATAVRPLGNRTWAIDTPEGTFTSKDSGCGCG